MQVAVAAFGAVPLSGMLFSVSSLSIDAPFVQAILSEKLGIGTHEFALPLFYSLLAGLSTVRPHTASPSPPAQSDPPSGQVKILLHGENFALCCTQPSKGLGIRSVAGRKLLEEVRAPRASRDAGGGGGGGRDTRRFRVTERHRQNRNSSIATTLHLTRTRVSSNSGHTPPKRLTVGLFLGACEHPTDGACPSQVPPLSC